MLSHQETRFYIHYNEQGKPIVTAIQRPTGSTDASYKKTAKEAVESAIALRRREMENIQRTLTQDEVYIKQLQNLLEEGKAT